MAGPPARPGHRPNGPEIATPPAPPAPSVTLSGVCWSGMNAQQVVDRLIGPREDRRTGDPEQDCVLAFRAIDDLLRDLPVVRSLLLWTLYRIFRQLGGDVWLRVAQAIGHKKSTVGSWAHQQKIPDLI